MSATPITGRYQTTLREYLGHTPALSRGTKFSNGFGAVATLLAVLSLPDPILVALEGALALALFSGYYSMPFSWLTLRSRKAQLERPVDVVVDDAGLHFKQGPVELEIAWEDVTRLREDRSFFFLTARYSRAFVFPKRTFDPAQLDSFRLLAAARGKPGRG